MKKRNWEYAYKGDYHKNLDSKWRYYPVYVNKIILVRKFLANFSKHKKIIDLGCGEGVLVESLLEQGYKITGIDANYESKYVSKGNITNTNFPNESYDLVLCLDVLEHLDFQEQEAAIKEIDRILKPDGMLVTTIPNLAHLLSRFSFLLSGRLIRTSSIERHPGDRPIFEYIKMIKRYFIITKRKGIFPTFPFLSILTYFFPGKVVFLHKIYNFFPFPASWSFLNYFECKKKLIDQNQLY